MNRDILVIKYYNRPACADLGTERVYAKVEAKPGKKNPGFTTRTTVIERSEALKLISDLGLVPALENPDGKIWDTPNKDFLKTYGGRINVV